MKSKKQNKTGWIILATLAVVVTIVIINIYIIRNDAFWNTSVTSCAELLITILVGYLFIEKKQDERIKKDLFVMSVDKMISKLDNELFYKISNNIDVENVLSDTKELKALCQVLQNNMNNGNMKTSLLDVEKELYEYGLFIENHKTDISYLRKSKSDLQYRTNKIIKGLQIVKFQVYA